MRYTGGDPFPILSMRVSLSTLVAECLGAFVLAFGVALSVADPAALPTPVIAGLTLGTMVYIFGGVSGCHINPAVTLGLWSRGTLKTDKAIAYVVAQLVGGFLAAVVTAYAFGKVPVFDTGSNGLAIVVAEAAGAFLLVLGVSAVVDGRVSQGASGLTIGSSLLLGILVAAHWSAGVLNPAVAVGLGSVSLSYLLAPVAGGIIAAQLSKVWMKK